ncbi:hypothetical protein NDJ00_08355 [Vibrio parahaemolyticus]|uniref:hypothetical protein n=1 Tax=Vibrio parahaemolyticus TaxID=670 RepID=UPI0006C1DE18|nr:hypothetical protein [Vibrio parahaemolyticus]KOY41460.1 hypothetical protein ACX10_01165 [Vibrio parahaemolyticus]MCS0114197.1 hypothetical protein [Vibrio parahaemolyticus]
MNEKTLAIILQATVKNAVGVLQGAEAHQLNEFLILETKTKIKKNLADELIKRAELDGDVQISLTFIPGDEDKRLAMIAKIKSEIVKVQTETLQELQKALVLVNESINGAVVFTEDEKEH